MKSVYVLLGMAGVFSAARANLVINGDFESTPGGFTVSGQGLDGWTVLGADPSYEVYVFGPTPGFGPQSNALDLGGFTDANDMGVEQTVATVTGVTYQLRFDYWTGADVIPGTIDLYVDGALVENELSSGPDSLPRTYSMQFTATGPTTLRFLTGDLVIANDIDNVSIEVVPEPASLAMLGLGTMVLLAKRRSGRTSA